MSWRRRWRDLSLEHELPLLMTGVLVIVLAGSLLLTYGTLAHSAEQAARERLERAAQEVAASAGATTRENGERLSAIAQSPELGWYLSAGSADREALESALAPALRTASDSALPLLLLDGAGEPLHARGDAAQPDLDALRQLLAHAAARSPASETLYVSPLYLRGTEVRFWAAARRIGPTGASIFVAQARRVGGPRDAAATLQALLGQRVTMYLRNLTDTLWIEAPATLATAPVRRESRPEGLTHHRRGAGVFVAAEARVDDNPWAIVLETSQRAAVAPARRALLPLALISLLLTVLGALLSRLISRRVTRPLVSLTHAAEEMARGHAAAPVLSSGGDEIGRLATSFSQMATEVTLARRELEQRVTEAQSSADTLARTNAQLQQAILDAEHAREEAERANRAKSDFLAVMSHELRTPLNAIGGYAQLLDLEVFGPVTDPQRQTLGRIARNQAHLLRLINEVLNFARIDAGQVEFRLTGVPLHAALEDMEALVAPQVRAKHLTLTVEPTDDAVLVHADRERVQQIVLNLLVNAVKFTPPGGRVTLSTEADDEVVRIRVRDTGVGIPPEHLASIFDPFVQGDRALNRPHEGVGLGLAISRDLAAGMDGDLSAESTPGVGSVFTLTLRRAEEADPHPAVPGADPVSPAAPYAI